MDVSVKLLARLLTLRSYHHRYIRWIVAYNCASPQFGGIAV